MSYKEVKKTAASQVLRRSPQVPPGLSLLAPTAQQRMEVSSSSSSRLPRPRRCLGYLQAWDATCRHPNCSKVTPQTVGRREAVTLCKGFNISAGHRVKLIIYD